MLVFAFVIIEETNEEELKRMRAALAVKEDWFRKIVSLPSEKVEWRWDMEYPTTFLVRQARAADLVVVKRKQLKQDEYHYIRFRDCYAPVGSANVIGT